MQRLKPPLKAFHFIAAMNRCATQNQHGLTFQQPAWHRPVWRTTPFYDSGTAFLNSSRRGWREGAS